MAYYGLLDRTPEGRNEPPDEPLWIRRHDEYDELGVGRGGAVRQDQRVPAGLDPPGGVDGSCAISFCERVDLLLAGDDPEQAADPVRAPGR